MGKHMAHTGTPKATYLFREYVYEVNAWFNVTSGSMTPQAQAAARHTTRPGRPREDSRDEGTT
eukprot:441969-Pyramimonas_sp.AAC.1